jgi:two-component system LytT family response regulator
MLNALLIVPDGESLATLRLSIEQQCPHLEILAECHDFLSAVDLIRVLRPDIVFLHTSVTGGSGFDLLNALPEVPFQLIFVTSDNKFAMRATRFDLADLLPASAEDEESPLPSLEEIYAPSREYLPHSLSASALNAEFRPSQPQKLAVPSLDGIDYVDLREILYCQSHKSYTEIFLKDQPKLTSSRNLGRFEEILDPSIFFRSHNSFLINVHEISKYIRGEGGEVVLSSGATLPVSRRRKENLMGVLGLMGGLV